MKIDLSKYSIRTDLVLEDSECYDKKICEKVFNVEHNKITKIVIDKETEKKFNKKEGIYYTIETDAILENDSKSLEELEEAVTMTLEMIFDDLSIKENDTVMVIGLGNDYVTPDALGPAVVDRILVTRHLFILQENVAKGFKNVCAFSPGVMGQTGMETSDIISSIVDNIKPNLLIVVDALAARSINRINRTIQITDAGINPGSGVGNKRKEISKETAGCNVVAIGIPTVLDVATIVSNAFDILKDNLNMKNNNEYLLGQVGLLTEAEKMKLLEETLEPNGLNMMVTPKDIDEYIKVIADTLGNAINKALHRV